MIFKIVTLLCYSIVGVASLITGFIYLFKKEYTKYHKQATGINWGSLDERVRLVILALLKLGGTGFIISGISMLGVIGIFYNNFLGLFISTLIGLIFWISSFLITSWLKKLTGAQTPIKPSLLNITLILTGLVSYISSIVFSRFI